MTAEKKKEVIRVSIPVGIISFIVAGSTIIKFRMLDVVYLTMVALIYIRYLIQVKRRVD